MSTLLLTPEQEAEAEQLADLLRQATAADFLHLARLLVSRTPAQTFGPTEFDARTILLRMGATAFHTFLAQKKTATSGRV